MIIRNIVLLFLKFCVFNLFYNFPSNMHEHTYIYMFFLYILCFISGQLTFFLNMKAINFFRKLFKNFQLLYSFFIPFLFRVFIVKNFVLIAFPFWALSLFIIEKNSPFILFYFKFKKSLNIALYKKI